MNSSFPLLSLQLLADRKLQPGALLLGFHGDEVESISRLADQPAFTALTAALPCFVHAEQGARLPPDSLQALQDAGCRLLDDEVLYRADESARPTLPAAALWLSGNWYLAPPAKPTGSQSASRTLALKLVQLVAADAETRDIEEIFRQDPTLSYHLLRLVNSLGIGTSKRITSFSQAILILGRQQLRRWLNLMLFAARKDDHRAAMLLARVAMRAHGMELLARMLGLDKSGQELAFMAGMFSLLDVLFGLPLAEVLRPLQISEVLVDAVLRREGDLGAILKLVELAEHGDGAGVSDALHALSVSVDCFNLLQIEACQWMLSITRDTQGTAHA